MSATIKDTGVVYVDDDLIGRLDGLKFTSDTSQGGLEAQALAAAAQKAVGPEVDRRLTSISSGFSSSTVTKGGNSNEDFAIHLNGDR